MMGMRLLTSISFYPSNILNYVGVSIPLAVVLPLMLVILSNRAVPPSLILASRRSRRRRAACCAGDSSADMSGVVEVDRLRSTGGSARSS